MKLFISCAASDNASRDAFSGLIEIVRALEDSTTKLDVLREMFTCSRHTVGKMADNLDAIISIVEGMGEKKQAARALLDAPMRLVGQALSDDDLTRISARLKQVAGVQ